MKIALIEPSARVQTALSQYFSLFTDHYFSPKAVKPTDYPESYSFSDFEYCASYFESISPTYTRWKGASVSYFDLRRNFIAKAGSIARLMQEKEIGHIIIFSSSPHHINTELFIAAARASNARVICLRITVFGGKLLPIFYNGLSTPPEVVSGRYSNEDAEPLIKDFYNNAVKKLPPKINSKSVFWKKSFTFSLLRILYEFSKLMTKKYVLNRNNVQHSLFLDTYTIGDHLRLVFNQKVYLKAFARLSRTDKCDFTVMAHLQPEATSFPDGGRLYDHKLICDLLSEATDHKATIAFKEHPATFCYQSEVIGFTRVGLFRTSQFAHEISCSKVNVTETLQGFPVTLTGSIALERSLVGLKTVVLGNPWYGSLPGTVNLDDVNQLLSECPSSASIDLQDQAYSYLLDLLQNRLLTNPVGIGNGGKIDHSSDWTSFIDSLTKLCDDLENS